MEISFQYSGSPVSHFFAVKQPTSLHAIHIGYLFMQNNDGPDLALHDEILTS
jgi:hypothetical protein